MVSPIFNGDNRVMFKPDTHTYWDGDTQLRSVTRLLNTITEPFDKQFMSRKVAEARARKEGGDPDVLQMKVLDEWEEKRKSSEVRGNHIHDNLESYVLKGKYSKDLQPVIEQIAPILREGYRLYPEALLYSTRFKTAGLTDLAIQRQKSPNSLFDFWDYKTNESKGIQFDSMDRKKDPVRHYNRYFLPPFDHLEDSNYNRYCLQLSCYAFMAMDTWGIKVGRLGILFVDLKMKVHVIPVPFMKMEAELLLSRNLEMKNLPPANHVHIDQFVPQGSDDDW